MNSRIDNKNHKTIVALFRLFLNAYFGGLFGCLIGFVVGAGIWIVSHPETQWDDGDMGQLGAFVIGAPIGSLIGVIIGATAFHFVGIHLVRKISR